MVMNMRRYKLQDRNRQRFLKMPKDLILNDYYRENLNSTSKMVYSMLLDRMELSRKNEWTNKNNEIYLLYTKKEVAKKLNVSERTVYNCFNELEKVDLIEQERQGLNQPNKIFIGKTEADKATKASSQPDVKRPSGQDMNNTQGSETDCRETNHNTHMLSPAKEARIESSESMNIYLEKFRNYVGGKHGPVKYDTFYDVSAKLEEYYKGVDEVEFRQTLDEYFENFNGDGLPKLQHFNEVAPRYLE